MRILHISKYYFPYLGGVESICKYLVERMPKHITSVVCFNNQRENAVDEINGHRIYRIATFVTLLVRHCHCRIKMDCDGLF